MRSGRGGKNVGRFLVALALAAVAGCTEPGADSITGSLGGRAGAKELNDSEPIPLRPFGDEEEPLLHSALRGRLGDVGSFDGVPYKAERSRIDSYDWVQLEVESPRGVSMALLTIVGGLRHDSLEPGAHLTLGSLSSSGDRGKLQVGVLGCSGPSPDNWEYDSPAEWTEIEVVEGPSGDTRTLHFTAGFSNDPNDWVDGSFTYDARH